jgi:hypothetical protein
VVRGSAPGVRPDVAPAAPPVGPPARRTRITPRNGTRSTGTRPGRLKQPRIRSGAAPGENPPRRPVRPGRRPPHSMPLPERSVIRHCARPPTRSTGPRGPPTGRYRTGPLGETGSAPPPGSSPWQAAARPTPRRPRFTWRRASSGWPGRSASCGQAQQHAAQAAAARRAAEGLHAALSRSRAGAAALGMATQARPAQTIRKPGGAARLDFPVPLQPGPLAPKSSGHAAPQSSPRSRPTANAPTRAGPGGEPSQSSHDPPHSAMASGSTRSRIRSLRPQRVATWVMTPSSSSTLRANPAMSK